MLTITNEQTSTQPPPLVLSGTDLDDPAKMISYEIQERYRNNRNAWYAKRRKLWWKTWGWEE
ncbi:MAG: hypothetical protein GY737_00205 [Desulfobacteraceae bacterium]|nr:hypothetical protein [Desulfobacteraceae bacterium]